MAFIAQQSYKIDLTPQGGYVVVYVSQHDNGARGVVFKVYNQGKVFDIPANINVSVQGVKPNGGYFTHNCTYSGNLVTMAIADDMTDVIGKAVCVLKFTNSSQQKLATAKFILNVDSDSSSEGIIIDTEAEEIFDQLLDEIRAQAAVFNVNIATLQSMVGTPLIATTAAGMTNHNKIYVYTGNETGYTYGDWYYWDGTEWQSGGQYNSVPIVVDQTPTSGSINPVSSNGVYTELGNKVDKVSGKGLSTEDYTTSDKTKLAGLTQIEVDDTLSVAGRAADAKVTGDKFNRVESGFGDLAEIAESKNVYHSTLIRGNVASDGRVITNPEGTSTRTDYIPVDGGETYIASYIDSTESNINVYVSKFSADKTFISRTNLGVSKTVTSPFTLESNCAFIIMHWTYTVEAELSNIQIEKGTTITPYKPFEYIVKEDKIPGYVDCLDRVTNLETSIDEALRIDNADFIKPKYAPFEITLTASKYIAANGTIADIANSHYKVSQYIDVSNIDAVYVSANGDFSHGVAAFYKDDYIVDSVPLKANSGSTITQFVDELLAVPTTAKYLVIAGVDQAYNPSGYYQEGYKLKKWTGLKWAAVGDSLTEINVRTTMHYHDYIAQDTGITVINMGRSGTGYKRQYEDNLAFYQRIANVPADADVVTIFGSGNDQLYYSDTDMGTATDVFDAENPEDNTLGACINHTIDVLYSIIPTVQLGIIAPCPWTNYNPANHNNGMAKYTELLRQICFNRSIPFLDMYHESNLRPWDASFRELAYSKDGGSGTHPDETGHKLMAGRFRVFLDSLLGITDKNQ